MTDPNDRPPQKPFRVLAVYEIKTPGGFAHGNMELLVNGALEADDLSEARRVIGEAFERSEGMPAKTVVILNLIRLPIARGPEQQDREVGRCDLTTGQSRLSSLAETCLSIAIGFIVSMVITAFLLPAYGHPVSLGDNFQITAIYTVASVARGYLVRRWFNGMGRKP
jgi:hypothetical protein